MTGQLRIPGQAAARPMAPHVFPCPPRSLVDTGAGVLAGHARLRGALRAGLPQLPVIVLDHLSQVQKRGLRPFARDNRPKGNEAVKEF